jgi:hypothetical protein
MERIRTLFNKGNRDLDLSEMDPSLCMRACLSVAWWSCLFVFYPTPFWFRSLSCHAYVSMYCMMSIEELATAHTAGTKLFCRILFILLHYKILSICSTQYQARSLFLIAPCLPWIGSCHLALARTVCRSRCSPSPTTVPTTRQRAAAGQSKLRPEVIRSYRYLSQ